MRSSSGVTAVARWEVNEAPALIPVYGHRFVPAARDTFGNLVLSVCGTDIIRYGVDLTDYVNQEFEEPRARAPERLPREGHRAVLARLPVAPMETAPGASRRGPQL